MSWYEIIEILNVTLGNTIPSVLYLQMFSRSLSRMTSRSRSPTLLFPDIFNGYVFPDMFNFAAYLWYKTIMEETGNVVHSRRLVHSDHHVQACYSTVKQLQKCVHGAEEP